MRTLISFLLLFSTAGSMLAAVGSSYNPSPTLRGINREVHIAVRTDGRPGTGTADDPFDGSTAVKFDNAFSNAVSASASVHLGPGTFLTAGNAFPAFRFPLVGGAWKVQGAGIDVTTIKLSPGTVTTSNATHYVIGEHANDVPAGQTPEFIEFSGLTIDANSANQYSVTNSPPFPCTISALSLGARRTYVHHVRITGTAGITNECFGLSLAAPNVTNSFHVVEACVADGLTGYQTAINVAGSATTNRVAGVVRDCVVQGGGSTVAGEGQNGFGTWHASGVQFLNNLASGVVSAFICDTFDNTNIVFRANRVAAPYGWGVNLGGAGAYDGVEVSGNWFGPHAASTGVALPTPAPANLLTVGNIVLSDTAGITNMPAASIGGTLHYPLMVGSTTALLPVHTNFFTANQAALNAAVTNGGSGIPTLNGTGTNLTADGFTVSSATATLGQTNLSNLYLSGASNAVTDVSWLAHGRLRWLLRRGDAETGGNNGSGLSLTAYDDGGSVTDQPLSLGRASGTGVTIARPFNVTGAITNAALTASTLVYADANKKLTSATIGTGLDFTAGTLSATGSSAALSALTAAVADNSITNGTNSQAWYWSLTNALDTGLTIGESAPSTAVGEKLVYVFTSATSEAKPFSVTARGATAFEVLKTGESYLDNNLLIGYNVSPTGMAKGATLFDGTAPSANPASGVAHWSYLGSPQYRGTNTTSGGGGNTNWLHNAAAIIVGAGTDYSPTSSYARVDFGTTDVELTLPTAGTYALDATVAYAADSFSGLTYYVEFYNSTDAAAVAESERVVTTDGSMAEAQIVLQALVTVTASKTIQLYAKCAEPQPIRAVRTSMRYIRLY